MCRAQFPQRHHKFKCSDAFPNFSPGHCEVRGTMVKKLFKNDICRCETERCPSNFKFISTRPAIRRIPNHWKGFWKK